MKRLLVRLNLIVPRLSRMVTRISVFWEFRRRTTGTKVFAAVIHCLLWWRI